MEERKKPQQEEFDLGSLFGVIGLGLKNLFYAIWKVLTTAFHFFILILVFLKKHLLKLGTAIVIGAIAGLFIENIKPAEYHSEMVVQTNFGSGFQLYKQVTYLNNLVLKKDTIPLSQALQISTEEASQLKYFKITAYEPKRNLYKSYDEYIKSTDTIYTRNLKIEDFKRRLDEYDYPYHEVTVKSSSKSIFKKLSKGIKTLVENEYFQKKRDLKKNELEHKSIILQKNMVQIDSLRSLYQKVALLEAQRLTRTAATVEISQKESDNSKNDIELFITSNNILNELDDLNEQIISNENILNIMSDFSEVGVLNKKITNKKYFQMAWLFGSIMLLYILLVQLNGYLNNYQKKD